MSADWLINWHLLRPFWLLALIPAVLASLYVWRLSKNNSAWSGVIEAHLLKHLLIPQSQVDKGRISHWWYLAAAVLAIIAMAGPTFEKRPLPVFETEISKVILLDLSLSMDATDIEPSRLTRAKYKINDILGGSHEGQIALIVYAGDAFVISPLTTDAKTIATLIPPLSPALMPVLGSEPASAFALADELLKNAGVFSGQIIWITDGVDDDDYIDTRDIISRINHQLSILAVGTADGAPIPLPDGQGFLKNDRGEIVVPGLNYSVLEDMAVAANGFISPLTASDEDIQYLMSQLKQPSEFIASDDDLEMDTWIEFGPWLLLPVLVLISLAFRRGLVFSLLLFFMPLQPPPIQAAEADKPQLADKSSGSLLSALDWLWLNPDQQGQKAFKQGQHQSAAQLFDDPAWRSAALYRAGDYQAATDANAQAEDADAWYNRGNALAKGGALEEAIAAYEQALEQQPDMEDAQFNKKLVEDLLKDQQQQQQEQDDQQQQDQQNQDQQNQQQQDQQQQQEQENQDQQNQQQQDQQQQQEQDMESLEEMSEEEKQQVLEQWLRQIKDDPGGLLRRKMYMEYQKRQKQNKALQQQGEKVW